MTKERARRKAEQYLEWAEKADQKRKQLSDSWYSVYGEFDWTEPIKLGHHSQRRHERVFERRDSFMRKQSELEARAERFREKANNLLEFASRNKGDAERAREARRQELDQMISVGTEVHSFLVRGKVGTVVRVFPKSYRVDFGEIGPRTIRKDFCEPFHG